MAPMDLAALVIATSALFFTVTSFWWLHARPGLLRAYRAASFASGMSSENLILYLPLVLHNMGPTTLAVLDLRVRFELLPRFHRRPPHRASRSNFPPVAVVRLILHSKRTCHRQREAGPSRARTRLKSRQERYGFVFST